MRVDHRGADILVAEQLLDGPDVVTLLEQVGGKRVTEGVARGRLGNPGTADRILTARWRTDSWRWWRRRWPVRPSIYRRVAGKIHCHPQSRPAFGDLRVSAPGRAAQPGPRRASARGLSRTRPMWGLRTGFAPAGSSVTP